MTPPKSASLLRVNLADGAQVRDRLRCCIAGADMLVVMP